MGDVSAAGVDGDGGRTCQGGHFEPWPGNHHLAAVAHAALEWRTCARRGPQPMINTSPFKSSVLLVNLSLLQMIQPKGNLGHMNIDMPSASSSLK